MSTQHLAARLRLGHLHAKGIRVLAAAHPRALPARGLKLERQSGRFGKRALVVAQDLRLRELFGNRA